jgi:uncharacterized protein YndB with AHSA1/START domain
MSSLTIVRRIKARPEVVFELLVTAEGLGQWIGPDAGPVLIAESEVRVGGRFRVRFRTLDGSEHDGSGEYLEIDAPHRLVYSWTWRGEEGAPASRVEIDLRPIADGTELTFTHALLSDEDSARSHREGWNGALSKLATIAERG